MNFYVAGYYLIQSSFKICRKLPDAWIFDWVTDNTSILERERVVEMLGFFPAEFSAMQKDIEELFKED